MDKQTAFYSADAPLPCCSYGKRYILTMDVQ